MSVVLVPHSQASIAPYVWSPLAGAQRAFESTVGFHASRVLGMDVLRTHFPGRKRIALQTSSMGTWRTPWICCLSRCRQRMSRFRSVPSCLALGYPIHASRSAFAASTTGPHMLSTSASVLTKTRIASAFADHVTTTSSRLMPAGFPMTRTFIPSFRFSFCASLIPATSSHPLRR